MAVVEKFSDLLPAVFAIRISICPRLRHPNQFRDVAVHHDAGHCASYAPTKVCLTHLPVPVSPATLDAQYANILYSDHMHLFAGTTSMKHEVYFMTV